MLRSERWNWRGLLLLSIICLLTATSARALELEMSVGGGYDDNPYQEKGSDGAAFSQAAINIWWRLPFESFPSTSITLLSFADYRLYDGLGDTWQLGGGLESSTELSWIPCNLEFFSEAVTHRNSLVDDNEFDGLSLGSRLVWLADSRLSLEFETSLNWEDYYRTVAAGKNKKGTDHSLDDDDSDHELPHNPNKTGQPKYHNKGDRCDRLVATTFKAFYAFSPYLDGSSEIFWHHRHSSIDAEMRSVYGLGVNFNCHPTPTLEFIWALSGERVPYKHDYRKEKRTEKIYTSEVTASWRRGNWTISGAWSWSKRDSIVNEDDYRRNQWQGRLTYSY